MVHTTMKIEDDAWKMVRLKAEIDDLSVREALEEILYEYAEENGEEYGYPRTKKNTNTKK